MRLPGSVQQGRQDLETALSRTQGDRRTLLKFAYDNILSAGIPNVDKLPVQLRTAGMNAQSSGGSFYFTLDYSALDGDHVLAP